MRKTVIEVEFPLTSVAVMTTEVVEPTAKVVPAAGTELTDGDPSHKSVAV